MPIVHLSFLNPIEFGIWLEERVPSKDLIIFWKSCDTNMIFTDLWRAIRGIIRVF